MTNVGARPLNLHICFGKLLEDMVDLFLFFWLLRGSSALVSTGYYATCIFEGKFIVGYAFPCLGLAGYP